MRTGASAASCAQVDVVVVLGAGRVRSVDSYKAIARHRVVLVDADPGACEWLELRYGDDDRVQLLNAAVSGSGGSGKLRKFQLEQYNSVKEPGELLEIYPSLRVME